MMITVEKLKKTILDWNINVDDYEVDLTYDDNSVVGVKGVAVKINGIYFCFIQEFDDLDTAAYMLMRTIEIFAKKKPKENENEQIDR